MHGDDHVGIGPKLHGPRIWVVSAVVGSAVGYGLAQLVPGTLNDAGHAVVPLWLVAPFLTLLLSIALMPFISERIWHRHFPDYAFFLGAFVAAYYLAAFRQPFVGGKGSVGGHAVWHAAMEYYSFVALVCGLYIVSGGILVKINGKATALFNTALLAFGAVFANIVGTTGASMLLLRPFMRANEGRIKPIHIVFFIMIVSNCGGCLTPIGDPPLYLGYLKGVPFFWTLFHLWKEWLFVVSALLVLYFIIDWRLTRTSAAASTSASQQSVQPSRFSVGVTGLPGIICLVLMIAGVFIDPLLKARFGIEGVPYGATFQLLVAGISYFIANRRILSENQFSFFPVKEVGLLFLGIFLTMIPALGYLSANGDQLGLRSAGHYFFFTGFLSAVLDNAPTYVNFLQIALGPVEINRETIAALIKGEEEGKLILSAVSLGAVFFGAMTYIGNGPNFMVRTIAQSSGIKMPSFFGYLLWTSLILLPILIVNWWLFIM